MPNLIYKELRLTAHPTLYLFTLMGLMVLIPAYPYGMIFFFGCLSVQFTFQNARENRDAFYSASLPVQKRDCVRARYALVSLAQGLQLLLTIPPAFWRVSLLPQGNPAGIEANVAFFGFGLLIYALFNLIFFLVFYRTAYRVGAAFLYGLIPVVFLILGMETAVHFPGMAWMDGVAASDQLRQLPILISGALVYLFCSIFTCKEASKRFEKVDL